LVEPADLAAFRVAMAGDLALFSRLTSGEPDRPLIEWMRMSRYPRGLGLDLCGQNAESAIAALSQAIADLPPIAFREGREALSADYQAIFLNHGRSGFATESHWVGDDRSTLVAAWYDRFDYRLNGRLHCPLDSLAFELGFMAHLFDAPDVDDGNVLAESRLFLETHLLPWVPDFLQEWSRVSATPFYRGLAGLLGIYLRVLDDRLQQVQGDILSVPA
jgi:TorA maturation chaperone TorD